LRLLAATIAEQVVAAQTFCAKGCRTFTNANINGFGSAQEGT